MHMSRLLHPLPPNTISYYYSKRPWSLFLALFSILAILVPLLPFLLGRIMEIKTFIRVRTIKPPLPRTSLIFE